jgi:hypothetical protein
MNSHQMYQHADTQTQPVMANRVLPYPMSQRTPGQLVPTNCHCNSATPHGTTSTEVSK